MQEKIKNFKDFGVIVVVLSFIIIPLISYLCIVKILPELPINSASDLNNLLSFFYVIIIFVYTFLWVRLFNKLS